MFMDYASIVENMRGSTWPNSCMDSCGEILVVISLIGSFLIPVILIPKDKSKLNQNGQLLCGMAATGAIFRFGRILVWIYFHLRTVAKPYWNFSDVSFMILATALLVFAETLGAQFRDYRMCGTIQFGEQCTVHPLLS